MLGVIIGVTSVVLLVALGEGARTYVTREFSGMGANVLIVTPGKSETTGMIPLIGETVQKLTFEDAESVGRQAHGVKEVAPIVVGQGYLKYGNRRRTRCRWLNPKLNGVLAAQHRGTVDFTITDQTAMLSTFQTILDRLTFVVIGIAAISLVVGGVGIMNIMLVSVRERVREIGVRKAVGARNRDIMVQFLIESVILSTVGGCIGIVLGGLGSMAARRLFPALPTHMTLWAIAMAFSFSIAVGVFFGVYPARKASLADPVEALRYE